MNDIAAHETGEITFLEYEFYELADNTFLLVNIIEDEHFKTHYTRVYKIDEFA